MKPVHAVVAALAGFIGAPELRGRLARGAVGSLALKVAQTLLSFASGVLLARLLGAEGYGVYAYVFSLVTLLALPAGFGLPNLVVRETSRALARSEWGLVQGMWRWAGRTTAAISLVLIVLAGGVAWVFADRFTGLQLATFAWGLVLVPLLALGNLRGAALRGLHRVIEGQLPEQVLRPGVFFLLLLGAAFLLSAEKVSPATAMALHALASGLAFAVGAWFLWRATPAEIRRAAPVYNGRRWISNTLPLAFISGMQLINQHTDILMLGLFSTAAEVGIYRVAVQASTLVSFGVQAMNMVVAPQFAHLHALGDTRRLERVVKVSARAILFLTLPAVLLFVLYGKPLLKLVFGKEFGTAYVPLVILTFGRLVNSVMGSVGLLLNMTGYERDTARGMAIAAGGNIVLNLILIPVLGVNGAALATACSLALWNILLWRAVRHRLGINSMAFDFLGARRNIR